ncbi:LysR family transcriptional regulator [Leucobacter albus]|uniref:LysR family transcriptional regulator n=1 Tax=Leucobacter albus TaxID=272210 RepID=A0ABW3TPT6_9MICO
MELRVLRYFVAAAEAGSVTGGAARVHVSQPAVSRQLAALEREVGAALFERGRGALQLTHAGRRFLEMARDLLRRADEAKAVTSHSDPADVRLLAVAQSTTIERTIAAFSALHGAGLPLVDAVAASPAEVFDRVEATGADFGISTFAPPANWASRLITQVGITAHVPPGHPLFDRASVEVSELVEYPLLCMDRTHTARTSFDTAVAQAGVGLAQITEMRTASLAQAHAASGRGIAILTDQASFGVRTVRIMLDGSQVRMRLYAGWYADHFAAAHIRTWADALAAWVPTLPDVALIDAPPQVKLWGLHEEPRE